MTVTDAPEEERTWADRPRRGPPPLHPPPPPSGASPAPPPRGSPTTRLPRRHVFAHVEAATGRDGKQYVQTWRVGVATFRDAPKGRPAKEATTAYAQPGEMLAALDAFTRPKSRTVLWVHNVGYFARMVGLFERMPRAGWELDAWNMAPQGTWLVWRNGDRTITVVDVAAVFPMLLPELAKHFRLPDPATPSSGQGGDSVPVRARAHLQVIREAVVCYLQWLQDNDLGDWQLTGTGQAFMAFRHRFMTHQLLVHWDEDAREAERIAQWAGRTEAYWHGTKHHTRIEEWDLKSAYPRIAATSDVPVELVRTLGAGADIWQWIDRGGYAVLATVDVDTTQDLVPAKGRHGICWPTGRFSTVLWDPELRLLRDRGAHIRVDRCWVYRTEPALQEFASFLLGIRDSNSEDVPAWQKILAQHWGRAVIGRFSMQYPVWEYVGRHPRQGCRWWSQADAQTGEASELVHIGHGLWQTNGTTDWSNSIPAITGWVTSRCREILTRLRLEVGERKILYADTDSLLAEGRHHRAIAAVAARHPEWHLRVKSAWDRITILGPRAIITGTRVRVAGVPSKAVPMPGGTVAGEVWESLRAALVHARPTQVRVTPRRWKLRELDNRRTVGPDGWTTPIHLDGSP